MSAETSDLVVASIAVVVTVAGAAIAAIWKVIEYVNKKDEYQTSQRHKIREDFSLALAEADDRTDERLRALEGKPPSFPRRQRPRRMPGSDD